MRNIQYFNDNARNKSLWHFHDNSFKMLYLLLIATYVTEQYTDSNFYFIILLTAAYVVK